MSVISFGSTVFGPAGKNGRLDWEGMFGGTTPTKTTVKLIDQLMSAVAAKYYRVDAPDDAMEEYIYKRICNTLNGNQLDDRKTYKDVAEMIAKCAYNSPALRIDGAGYAYERALEDAIYQEILKEDIASGAARPTSAPEQPTERFCPQMTSVCETTKEVSFQRLHTAISFIAEALVGHDPSHEELCDAIARVASRLTSKIEKTSKSLSSVVGIMRELGVKLGVYETAPPSLKGVYYVKKLAKEISERLSARRA